MLAAMIVVGIIAVLAGLGYVAWIVYELLSAPLILEDLGLALSDDEDETAKSV